MCIICGTDLESGGVSMGDKTEQGKVSTLDFLKDLETFNYWLLNVYGWILDMLVQGCELSWCGWTSDMLVQRGICNVLLISLQNVWHVYLIDIMNEWLMTCLHDILIVIEIILLCMNACK